MECYFYLKKKIQMNKVKQTEKCLPFPIEYCSISNRFRLTNLTCSVVTVEKRKKKSMIMIKARLCFTTDVSFSKSHMGTACDGREQWRDLWNSQYDIEISANASALKRNRSEEGRSTFGPSEPQRPAIHKP